MDMIEQQLRAITRAVDLKNGQGTFEILDVLEDGLVKGVFCDWDGKTRTMFVQPDDLDLGNPVTYVHMD